MLYSGVGADYNAHSTKHVHCWEYGQRCDTLDAKKFLC